MQQPHNSKWKIAASLGLAASLALAGTVPAAVLLTDNFTVTSNSQDVNQELATRQTGPLAPASYTGGNLHHQVGNNGTDVGQPDPTDGNHVLLAFSGDFYLNNDVTTLSPAGPLTISFDMYRTGVTPGNDTDWAACTLRSGGNGNGFPVVGGAGEFGFLARKNGGIQVFQGGGGITPSGWDTAGFAVDSHFTLVFDNGSGGSAFNGTGSRVTFINGATILGTITLGQLDILNLKLGFSTSGGLFAGIDNLVIADVAPPVTPNQIANTLPSYGETVVGDTFVAMADFANYTGNLQWQVISGGVTNNVSGATSTTLTLNNVQVSDSGFYRLMATNAAGAAYSTTVQLNVGVAPTNGNVIVKYAGQDFNRNTNYFPVTWPVTTNSLIYGFTPGAGQGNFAFVGDFAAGNECNADPTILSDGVAASITSTPATVMVAGGLINASVGSSVTYTLNIGLTPLGYDLTNITVFGGWQDAGRDQQKYEILYATVAAPTTFISLGITDYNPGNRAARPSVSRTIMTPVNGVLAQNVVAVKINWNVSPGPKNGWEGYSELIVQGKASTATAPSLIQNTTPMAASDVVGGKIVLTAGFTNYTSLQWKKNGVSIPGAATTTLGLASFPLTLSNLTTNDTAVYTLVASSSAGSATSFGAAVTVRPTPAAVGNLVISIAEQTATYAVFTPSWDTSALGGSLISGLTPTSQGPGDFTGGTFGASPPTAGSDPSVLTDGSFGTVDFANSTAHLNWTCMGGGTGTGNTFGGQSVTYTLPVTANGYTITNIMTAGGWNDTGRDQQAYTVFYSTLQNPDIFLPIGSVDFNPASPVGYSLTRVTITPASGALATNVKALRFDMNFPNGENGYSGYSEFAIYGSPTATAPAPVPVITAQHEEGVVNGFTVETGNLIAGQLPTTFGAGIFTLEGLNVTNLTDGATDYNLGASCGYNPTNDPNGPVSFITFSPANGGSWNLTNIVVYSMHHDFGRDGQFYDVSYSTLAAPATFLPLATVIYNPDVTRDGRASGNRVEIAPQVGQTMLASNVAVVKFDFSRQGIQDFGWSDYTEIVLQGSNFGAPILNPATISGGNLILTGTGGSPANSSYTVLTTTNLAAPVIWTSSTTGTLVGGAFSNAIPISTTIPARFFRVQLP